MQKTPTAEAMSLTYKFGGRAIQMATQRRDALQKTIEDWQREGKELFNLPEMLDYANRVLAIVEKISAKNTAHVPCGSCPYVCNNTKGALTAAQQKHAVSMLRSSYIVRCSEGGAVCSGQLHMKNNCGFSVPERKNKELNQLLKDAEKSWSAKDCFSDVSDFLEFHSNTVTGYAAE